MAQHRLTLVLFLFTLVLVNTVLLAQEPPPEPTSEPPSLTPTYTDTPTDFPTYTPTDTPELVPTPSLTPTFDVTIEPTSTETPSMTWLPSPTSPDGLTPTFVPPTLFDGGEVDEPLPMARAGVDGIDETVPQSITVIGDYALVNAGDTSGLEDAVQRVNNGEISTLYLNSNIPPNAPDYQRTYWLNTRLRFNRSATIYGNNAILRLNNGVTNRVLLLWFNVTLNIHHVEITNGNLLGYRNPPSTLTDGYGAGIRVNAGSTLYLSDSKVYSNFGAEGGGGVMNLGRVELQRVRLYGNHAGGGGAVQNDSGGQMTAQCSSFMTNDAGYGGAVLNGNNLNGAAYINIYRSAFSGNTTYPLPNEGKDIVNLVEGTTFVFADNNWWGGNAYPNNGYRTQGITFGGVLVSNPTIPVSGGFYVYIECQPVPPVQPPSVCLDTLSMNSAIVDPNSNPCEQPVPTPTPTPFPVTNLCNQPISTIINQLSVYYKFNVIQSSYLDDFEIRQICEGVITTALALELFAESVIGGITYTSPSHAFASILINPVSSITFAISTNRQEVGQYNCISGLTTIVCGEGNAISEYTLTHELGHIFVARSTSVVQGTYPCYIPSSQTSRSFKLCINFPLGQGGALRVAQQFVFGPRALNYTRSAVADVLAQLNLPARFPNAPIPILTEDDFTYFPVANDPNAPPATVNPSEFYRGEAGWGSLVDSQGSCAISTSPDTSVSQFQQNPCQVLSWVEQALIRKGLQSEAGLDLLEDVELEEAAADMFLNWVYRLNGLGGFSNDIYGNARFDWMNTTLANFFAYYNW